MARTVAIGIQDFSELRVNDCFYIDKTDFIREWWENMDSVTLITRPRRFGKTLNLSMIEAFEMVQLEKQASYMGYLFRNRCTSRRELAQYYLYPQSYIPPITLSR